MPPPPAKWRGRCDFNGKQTCNNKLLGARSFLGAGDTPVEKDLHGSHTASEAAGSPVEGANVFGQANGTAMGIAPKAHLAMYKVDETDSSVLAAIDAAIEDGVDVLSISMDIIGPGVNILAAWGVSIDNATTPFSVESGTSMSCPHLSGVAALIKSAHPRWSPAAIRSAILTTAYTFDLSGHPISNVFDMGSGHVNPSKALNPGLVYDIEPDDYIPYLCGLGYSDKQVRMIVQRKVNCSSPGSSIPEAQLNYPTFSISLARGENQTYTRTVTNVGQPNSTYYGKVRSLEGAGVAVTIVPSEIKFKEVNEKASYSVTFTRLDNVARSSDVGQGSLVWSSLAAVADGDDRYEVVSTIAVNFV
ncbi:unnamed protein product [Linum tenue]|uniref:Uncharacterized protein n=1 Tax=Linum tenue TaxID=586396 RepID=A0AAV0JWA4_9ROSI|nr:unnamed protein product [Linum tenue]